MKWLLGLVFCLLGSYNYSMDATSGITLDLSAFAQPVVDKRIEIAAFRATIGIAVTRKLRMSSADTQIVGLYDEIVRRSYDGIDAVQETNVVGIARAKQDIADLFAHISHQQVKR